MPTKKNSISRKMRQASQRVNSPAKSTPAPIAAEPTTRTTNANNALTTRISPTAEKPYTLDGEFKVWHLETLSDLGKVDDWQFDKCFFMLKRHLLKCRMLKRKLISMDYHEQGHVRTIVEDLVTGERYVEPRLSDVADIIEELDPLA